MAAPRLSAGFEFGSACEGGRQRADHPNQDSVELVLPGLGETYPPLLLLADGMGGYRGGEIASRLVIQGMKEAYLGAPHPVEAGACLEDCLRAAHQLVQERALQKPAFASMGSTLVAAILTPQRVHVLNVGDSRAYLLRGRQMIQLSQDQSWVAEQMRAGLLTGEQALQHPKRSRLAMAISAKRSEVKGYSNSSVLEPDDILVLCSDGLWSVVAEALIWATASELEPQAAAEKLVALANASGGPDNISVIVARRHQAGHRPSLLEDTNP